MVTIQNKYRLGNAAIILESVLLSIGIVYNSLHMKYDTVIGMTLSIVALLVIIGLSLLSMSCYENIRFIKLKETMENDIPVVLLKNIILIMAIILVSL